MKLSPYLVFNGQCRAAFKLYEEVLGGKIQMIMTWGESPMADQFPKEAHDQIMHASILIGDSSLAGADAPPDRYEKPQGMSVIIPVKEVSEAERIFKALSEGGNVTMDLQQTFWAAAFGMLTDRFGIPWMINCEQAQ